MPTDPQPGQSPVPARANLGALRRFAESADRSPAARELFLDAVEEIARHRARAVVGTTPMPADRTAPSTQAEHKAEAERLLAVAHHNHQTISTTENDPTVATDELRGVALVLVEALVHSQLAAIPEPVELVADRSGP